MNITLHRFLISFCMIFLFLFKDTTTAQVTIIVNKGKFVSVEEAAIGEERANWSDGDLSDDRAITESFAATELATFLKSITSMTNIRFASPSNKLPVKGDIFLLGSRQSNPIITKVCPKAPDLKTNESLHIYTLRDHNRTITVIEGKDRVGVLYGVYAYLEQLGIKFYGLGEQGTVYPAKLSQLPQKMDITQSPSFLTRGFIGLGNRGDKDIFYWMARNRMNYLDEAGGTGTPFRKKLGMMLAKGGHQMIADYVGWQKEYPYNHPKFTGDEHKPKDPYASSNEYMGDKNGDGKLSYFEAHPEWYALRNGKRSDNGKIFGGDNFCTSNADACQELAKNQVQALIDGPFKDVDIVNMWVLDKGKWCECENCVKQGNFSDRLTHLGYAVQKEIQKAQQQKRLNRPIFLATLAYQETTPPPTKPLPKDFDYDHFSVTYFVIERCYAHHFSDSTCTEFNKELLDDYLGWTTGENRPYKGSIMLGEYYNVSSLKGLPVLYPKIMTADIPYFYKTGTKHLNYMHTPTHKWGTWTLNQYLLGRMLWNVETRTDTLLNSYFKHYYPTTSATTHKFYEHLEKAFSNIKPYKHFAGKKQYHYAHRLMRDTMEIFTKDHLNYDVFHPEKNDALDIVEMMDEMTLARKEIDKSLLQVTNKIEQTRLIDDDRRFAYGESMLGLYYHLTRTAILHRRAEVIMAKHEFKAVEKYAEQLRNVTDLVAPLPGFRSGDANAKDGLDASQDAEKVYNYFKTKYGSSQ